MDPNINSELQTNTLLNPDFGMHDEGVMLHTTDAKNEEVETNTPTETQLI